MSTLNVSTIVPDVGTNTDLSLDGKGTGVPDLGAGFKVGGTAGVPVSALRAGTDGELITWAADASATTVPVGTATHVLTSNGAGAAPTFQAAAGGGAWELITVATPSSSTNLDFTGFDSATYINYMFVVASVENAGTHSEHRFRMYTSSDGGSNYDDGTNEYGYAKTASTMRNLTGDQESGESKIEFMGGMTTTGSGANGTACGYVWMPNPQDATQYTPLFFHMTLKSTATTLYRVEGVYAREEAAIVNAVRWKWDSEDFADTGSISFFGMKKA
tara:strand:- start:336 stop:1157 length:822 start_codon:yes stop_codon:yes gene_type:complete